MSRNMTKCHGAPKETIVELPWEIVRHVCQSLKSLSK